MTQKVKQGISTSVLILKKQVILEVSFFARNIYETVIVTSGLSYIVYLWSYMSYYLHVSVKILFFLYIYYQRYKKRFLYQLTPPPNLVHYLQLRPCLDKSNKMRIYRSCKTRNCYAKDVFKARSHYAKDVIKTCWTPKIVCWTLLYLKGGKMGLCLKLTLHLNLLIPNLYIILIDIGILV